MLRLMRVEGFTFVRLFICISHSQGLISHS